MNPGHVAVVGVEPVPEGAGNHLGRIANDHAGLVEIGILAELRGLALAEIGEDEADIFARRIYFQFHARTERPVLVGLLVALAGLVEFPAVKAAAQPVSLDPADRHDRAAMRTARIGDMRHAVFAAIDGEFLAENFERLDLLGFEILRPHHGMPEHPQITPARRTRTNGFEIGVLQRSIERHCHLPKPNLFGFIIFPERGRFKKAPSQAGLSTHLHNHGLCPFAILHARNIVARDDAIWFTERAGTKRGGGLRDRTRERRIRERCREICCALRFRSCVSPRSRPACRRSRRQPIPVFSSGDRVPPPTRSFRPKSDFASASSSNTGSTSNMSISPAAAG